MNELEQIKKVYGERFMKLCRSLFPTILEDEGKLYTILSNSFSKNSKTLYEDITQNWLEEKFKNYIYSKMNVEKEKKPIIENKTPYELLDEAGYKLYECNTEQQIQAFKKYYAPGEELCTFGDKSRLDRCHVFFAVKKDVENIKREDFKTPKREDEYGTSVMGIQFTKQGLCTVSIKNRYNHMVNNPDATFGNDLDRIEYGLEQSFAELLKQRGLIFCKSNIEDMNIPGYIVANDGKYYKYNMEVNGIYYCPGNIVISNGTPQRLEKNEELIDYLIFDSKNKTVKPFDRTIKDDIVEQLQNINKIEIEKNKEIGENVKNVLIHIKGQEEPVNIKINKNNEIIEYINKSVEKISNNFLYNNNALSKLILPKCKQVGNNFLNSNEGLIQLELPELEQIGYHFLHSNKDLNKIELPKCKSVQWDFLQYNEGLTKLSMPNLEQIGDNFLFWNNKLSELSMPKLNQIGNYFLNSNEGLIQLELPNLKQVGVDFLSDNIVLTKLLLPKLEIAENNFLHSNEGLTRLELPKLKQAQNSFLYCNQVLTQLSLPSMEKVGRNFLYSNTKLTQLSLPKLKQTQNNFLLNNKNIVEVHLPNLEKCENEFIEKKQKITLKSIVKLDKDNKLTVDEVKNAGKSIDKTVAKENDIDNEV